MHSSVVGFLVVLCITLVLTVDGSDVRDRYDGRDRYNEIDRYDRKYRYDGRDRYDGRYRYDGRDRYDERDVCPEVEAFERVPTSAVGTWWVVLATKLDRYKECGLENNQYPCKCTGVQFRSYQRPPYLTEYNGTTFGYNPRLGDYQTEDSYFPIFDEDSSRSLFYFFDNRERSYKPSLLQTLGTDNHKNYLILFSCGERTDDGRPFVFVFSNTRKGLNRRSQEEVDKILRRNRISKKELYVFNPRSCPKFLR